MSHVAINISQQGHITPEQLRSMMHHANLGLSGLELQIVIAEADEDADGSIDVRAETQ